MVKAKGFKCWKKSKLSSPYLTIYESKLKRFYRVNIDKISNNSYDVTYQLQRDIGIHRPIGRFKKKSQALKSAKAYMKKHDKWGGY